MSTEVKPKPAARRTQRPASSTPAQPKTSRASRGGGKNPGLREEVNAYKRELILRAACETFYERGYHDTTVDMITDKLSGTKAIFYYSYADKQAVLVEIFKRALAAAQAVILRAIDEGGTPPEMLSAFARYYAEWVIDNQVLVGVFWREERCLSKDARAAVAAEQKKFDDMVARIIQDGVASGDFVVDDVQMTSRAISGMISFAYTWWRSDRRLNREETADYYATIALRIAGASAGNTLTRETA